IPAGPAAAVESAVSDAVRQGLLWLINGPASFQGKPVPAGVLTGTAQLRAPMAQLMVDRLTQDSVPEAWKDGQTTALALSVALSAKTGQSIPWAVGHIDPFGFGAFTRRPARPANGCRLPHETCSWNLRAMPAAAVLEPAALMDLVDILPDVVKATAKWSPRAKWMRGTSC